MPIVLSHTFLLNPTMSLLQKPHRRKLTPTHYRFLTPLSLWQQSKKRILLQIRCKMQVRFTQHSPKQMHLLLTLKQPQQLLYPLR